MDVDGRDGLYCCIFGSYFGTSLSLRVFLIFILLADQIAQSAYKIRLDPWILKFSPIVFKRFLSSFWNYCIVSILIETYSQLTL